MKKLECRCGGALQMDGSFYICDSCGSRWALSFDDEGTPFTYQPLEKKQLVSGQFAPKASKIAVNTVSVKEIRLDDTVRDSVVKESTRLQKSESVKLIETFLLHREWDSAQEQINRLLLEDPHCAEAAWFGWLCEKKAGNDRAYGCRRRGTEHRLGLLLRSKGAYFQILSGMRQ